MTRPNGLLLLDKAKGITSHDAVAGVRKVLHEKRVGHAGTLDPMATGLLVIAVGPSTRLLRFLQSATKRYVGEVTLGVATDSLDADGEVTERRDVEAIDDSAISAALLDYTGELSQVPPMVSALKVDGRRLHSLARAGMSVEREPRRVVIESFSVTKTDVVTKWCFDVTCSAGTYVRVLLSDFCESLGTIGHLSELRRVRSGEHLVEDATTMNVLERAVSDGSLQLLAPRNFVTHLGSVTISEDVARRLRMGQRVEREGDYDGEVAAVFETGELVAVMKPRGELWQPTVVLHPDE